MPRNGAAGGVVGVQVGGVLLLVIAFVAGGILWPKIRSKIR